MAPILALFGLVHTTDELDAQTNSTPQSTPQTNRSRTGDVERTVCPGSERLRIRQVTSSSGQRIDPHT